jgi:hypothetical protein
VQAVLEVKALCDAALQQLAPLGREAAARGGDADDGRRRVEAERVVDGGDDGHARLGLARAGRVEHGHDRVTGVAEDPAPRLPVVDVAGVALSEDQVPLL